jgi:hypothetical protein
MQSAVYLDWGRVEEARQVLERAPRTDDRILLWAWGTWSPTQAITRRRCVVWPRHEQRIAAALFVVERMLSQLLEEDPVRRHLSSIYAGLGRKEDAIREAKGWEACGGLVRDEKGLGGARSGEAEAAPRVHRGGDRRPSSAKLARRDPVRVMGSRGGDGGTGGPRDRRP